MSDYGVRERERQRPAARHLTDLLARARLVRRGSMPSLYPEALVAPSLRQSSVSSRGIRATADRDSRLR